MNSSLAQAMIGLTATSIFFSLAGCSPKDIDSKSKSESAEVVRIVDGQLPNEGTQAKMLAAKDELMTRLSGRLMDAMTKQGPAGAIEVCQKEAKKIAIEVGEKEHVRIGRTGVRLRNSENKAPSWAKQLVEAKTESPTFVMLTNRQSAALLPIKLQSQCLMCHGPSDSLSQDVRKQLSKLYPADQATGFAEGELRGWFWVEMQD